MNATLSTLGNFLNIMAVMPMASYFSTGLALAQQSWQAEMLSANFSRNVLFFRWGV